MGTIITVTKRLAARQEIEGAIRALAGHRNYIAAELLASAAIDVVAGVCKDSGITTISERFNERIKPDKRVEVRKLMRHPYNFLKHSDRDKNSAIDRYDSGAALWRVMIAILDYEACWKTRTFPMLIYMSWFFSRNPDIVQEESKHISESFSRFFGDIKAMSEREALATLGSVFKQFDDVSAQAMNHALFDVEHIER